MDDAQLLEVALSGNASLIRPVAGASRRELQWQLQAVKKLFRPKSGGLEFDVELMQHTAVDVLPNGCAMKFDVGSVYSWFISFCRSTPRWPRKIYSLPAWCCGARACLPDPGKAARCWSSMLLVIVRRTLWGCN